MASSYYSSSFFSIEPLDCGETCRCAMDACSRCGKRLAGDLDIFMYRGDTPFCSEECRHRQMVSDGMGASGKNKPCKTERPAMKEQPAGAEPARVQIVANVPVAI
ncbi:hypothetical protein HU200_007130 [Digitaria exilis]|uniref:FLZ-type domain-containing protein n=1 Tax=Digitaria exilis TaxID=1010633 RepID=A0A835FMQ6_9POAL|nr:hypothetical protein HU200_007130 [Digitaria exilis]CAB3450718.1 unnamed protein product [Digitaria exilis]